jgi:nucleotide-binding universal stress UspA family protein
MKPYHLLVPIDGSSFSRRCLEQIQRFFAPDSCRVTLLQVDELPATVLATPLPFSRYTSTVAGFETYRNAESTTHPIYAYQIEQSRQAELEFEMQPLAQELRAAGYKVSIAVRFGDPALEIVAAVAALEIDIIVMATHGRTGLSRLVLGSVAAHVVEAVSVPVMLTHPTREMLHEITARTADVELEVHA